MNISILLAAAASFLLVLIAAPIIIPALRSFKFGQNVRDDGPQSHLKKQGTPTMGGIMILLGAICASLAFMKPNGAMGLMLVTFLGYGILGGLDDAINIIKHRSMGLTPRQKMLGELLLAVFVTATAYWVLGGNTMVILPFARKTVDLGFFWFPLNIVLMLAITNAVNLTDGLDGLCSGVTAPAAAFFVYMAGTLVFEAGQVFGAALMGAVLGFLVYNFHPAKVFMGDCGSLALGGALGVMSILMGLQFYLPFVGFIYVIETLSVILQVASFKLTGKRIFKMAPLHHHFELCGYSEKGIFVLATGITVALVLIMALV